MKSDATILVGKFNGQSIFQINSFEDTYYVNSTKQEKYDTLEDAIADAKFNINDYI